LNEIKRENLKFLSLKWKLKPQPS